MSQDIAANTTEKAVEKQCSECGETINRKAVICPKCGVKQSGSEGVSKTALLLLTFFLGGIGAHKFYVGKNWQGFFYLIFCWTWIPGLISLVEFIIYAFTPSEVLREKYSAKGGAAVIIAVVVGAFAILALLGILSAIAIPQFVAYKNRAYQVSIESVLKDLAVAEASYFSEHGKYASSLQELNFSPVSPEMTIEILSADSACFEAVATHSNLPDVHVIDCNTY